jgi:hypothetical protein
VLSGSRTALPAKRGKEDCIFAFPRHFFIFFYYFSVFRMYDLEGIFLPTAQ